MPSDRQRDYVDAVKEWEHQQAEGGWRVDKRAEERVTVPAGSFDHYRQDPSDPATIGLETLMARVAEGRVSPGDATAIVTREVAVARGLGWEAFWAILSLRCALDALNPGMPWFVRLFVVVILWWSMVRVYRIRRERRSAQE